MLKLTPLEETVAGKELMQLGSVQTQKENIIDILEIRFETVPDTVRDLIEQLDDLTILKTRLKEAVKVTSLAEFEQNLTAHT